MQYLFFKKKVKKPKLVFSILSKLKWETYLFVEQFNVHRMKEKSQKMNTKFWDFSLKDTQKLKRRKVDFL